MLGGIEQKRRKLFSLVGGIDIVTSLLRYISEEPLLAAAPSVASFLFDLGPVGTFASTAFVFLTIYWFTASWSLDREFQRLYGAGGAALYILVQQDSANIWFLLLIVILLFLYRQLSLSSRDGLRWRIRSTSLEVYPVVILSYAFAAADPFLLLLEVGLIGAAVFRFRSAGPLGGVIESIENRILEFTQAASRTPYGIMIGVLIYSQILRISQYMTPITAFTGLQSLLSLNLFSEIAIGIIIMEITIPLVNLFGIAVMMSALVMSFGCLLYWFTILPYITDYIRYVDDSKSKPKPPSPGRILNLKYWFPLFSWLVMIAPVGAFRNARVVNGSVILLTRSSGQIHYYVLSPVILALFLAFWSFSIYYWINILRRLWTGDNSWFISNISNLKVMPGIIVCSSILQMALLGLYGLFMKLSIMYTVSYIGMVLLLFCSIYLQKFHISEAQYSLRITILLVPLLALPLANDYVRIGDPSLIAILAVFLNLGLATDLCIDALTSTAQ